MVLRDLPELPACDAASLAAAVRRLVGRQIVEAGSPSVPPSSLMARLPAAEVLGRGAAQLAAGEVEDPEAARYFRAIVEVCFLVASADGLAEEEKAAVAELIACACGEAFGADKAAALFDAFAALLVAEGLERRLDAVVAELEGYLAREEAMSFAALVAVADRALGDRELAVLVAFGKRCGFSFGEVQALIQQVAAALGRSIARVAHAED
jgi:hypothetical protein